MSVVKGFKRPDEARWKWLPKALAVSDTVDYNLYAHGRGKVKANGKSYCHGKWRNAETYGARGKKIKQLCIRLHEWHQDDRGYEDAPAKYDCVLDPNDKGNRHGSKNRDWLCYEKQPRYVALPPYGPSYDTICSSTEGDVPWVLSWYPEESPPEWCTYNWYSERQVCWCMPGFYRESPYDTSLEKRGCPDEEVFLAPRFVTYDYWLQLREPATTTPASPTQCSTARDDSIYYTDFDGYELDDV
ncbi:hypothetical protein FOL47_010515 [Perkinsus chesapeaki]|uniref:Uncharacterized protein n=1 Tax=Perkinsus chesapeaki TaxID=330153 RepID=A0A7J6MPD8_PERCH|nr:hypothetical protein FOL47_010515 [Perkinsus chesapeaki]